MPALTTAAGTAAFAGGAIAGWAIQFDMVRRTFDATVAPANRAKDSAKAFAEALAEVNRQAEIGLLTGGDAVAKRIELTKTRIVELQARLRQIAEENKQAADGGMWSALMPWTWYGIAARDGEAVNARNEIDRLKSTLPGSSYGPGRSPVEDFQVQLKSGLDDVEVRKGYGLLTGSEAAQAKLSVLERAYDDLQERISKASDFTREELSSQVDPLIEQIKAQRELTKGFEDASKQLDAYNEGFDRLAEIQKELYEGGQNDTGESISLEAEKALAIKKQEAETAQRIAELREREKKATEEIASIKADAAEQIAAIQDEGIAQRALSETQDKAARIAKVQAEAGAKQKAKEDEIAGIQDQIAVEQEQGKLALARIRNLADAKIEALNAERAKIEANVSAAARQLGIERSITEEIRRRASGGSSSGPSYSNDYNSSTVNMTNTTPGPGLKPWYTDSHGVVHYHQAATGGLVAGGVPGKDSVPVMTMPGELIVSNPLTKGLAAMVAAYQRGNIRPVSPPPPPRAGSGVGNTTINVTINPSPGMDEAAIGRAAVKAINQRIRNWGPGFQR